jgi:hypothetical protein
MKLGTLCVVVTPSIASSCGLYNYTSHTKSIQRLDRQPLIILDRSQPIIDRE